MLWMLFTVSGRKMVDLGAAIHMIFTHLNNQAVLQAVHIVIDDDTWKFRQDLRNRLTFLLEAQEFLVKASIDDIKKARKEASGEKAGNKEKGRRSRKQPQVRPKDDGSEEATV